MAPTPAKGEGQPIPGGRGVKGSLSASQILCENLARNLCSAFKDLHGYASCFS